MLAALDKDVLEPGATDAEDVRLVFERLFDVEDITKGGRDAN